MITTIPPSAMLHELLIWARSAYFIIRTIQLIFSAKTVFFSHNNSARTVFFSQVSAGRTSVQINLCRPMASFKFEQEIVGKSIARGCIAWRTRHNASLLKLLRAMVVLGLHHSKLVSV